MQLFRSPNKEIISPAKNFHRDVPAFRIDGDGDEVGSSGGDEIGSSAGGKNGEGDIGDGWAGEGNAVDDWEGGGALGTGNSEQHEEAVRVGGCDVGTFRDRARRQMQRHGMALRIG